MKNVAIFLIGFYIIFADEFLQTQKALEDFMPKYGFGEPIQVQKVTPKQEHKQKINDINETNKTAKKHISTAEEKELKELNISNGFLWKLIKDKDNNKTSKK